MASRGFASNLVMLISSLGVDMGSGGQSEMSMKGRIDPSAIMDFYNTAERVPDHNPYKASVGNYTWGHRTRIPPNTYD